MRTPHTTSKQKSSFNRIAAFGVGLLAVSAAMSAQAVVSGFSEQGLWASAASPTALETFDTLPTGAVTSLPSVGVTSMSGLNVNDVPVGQYITSQFALPFPMFIAGALPSSPNFLSNDLSPSGGYATGSILFNFNSPLTAVGAYVADSSPLGGFSIEVFNGNTSLGSINVGPRTLPDSFVGIISDQPFTSAKFAALVTSDSWGLDNLQVASVPEPTTLAMAGLGGLTAWVAARRRKHEIRGNRRSQKPAPNQPSEIKHR